MNEQAYYAEPSRLDRLRWWLFPQPARPRREDDPRTFLTTDVYVTVDWLDRLRLALTGRVKVQVVTYTDVEVKQAESLSVFSVLP